MTKIKKHKTTILFPRTSTIIGMGSIFNIAGNYFGFNYSASGEEADTKAIESDWAMIGQDIEESINKTNNKLVST
jgi:hypothetical protein